MIREYPCEIDPLRGIHLFLMCDFFFFFVIRHAGIFWVACKYEDRFGRFFLFRPDKNSVEIVYLGVSLVTNVKSDLYSWFCDLISGIREQELPL